MMLFALAMILQTQSGPWDKYKNDPLPTPLQEGTTATNPKTGERVILRNGRWVPVLGPGPHTLIISDGNGMTRMDYKSGAACERAKNIIQLQVAPPPNTKDVIYGPPRTTAVCVPR